MQLVKPTPFPEAVNKLGLRQLIGSQLDTAAWRSLPDGLRDRAFFSSQVESLRFLQRSRDSITDFLQSSRETLPTGETILKTGSRADFVKQMQAFAIAEGMGPLDPQDAGTLKDITSQSRLDLIIDTQAKLAYGHGDFLQSQDPDVLDAFPAQRFIRVIDVTTPRDSHTQYEGMVRLKTDLEFWKRINEDFGNPYPPFGWGCGHDVEDVDRAEAESLGLLDPDTQLTPALDDFNHDLQASTENLDPDMLAFLRRELGPKVTITGDTARWTPSQESEQ